MNIIRIVFTVFIILPSLLFSQTAQDSLTIELSMLTGDNALVGFGVAIVNQNGILYSKGFGFSDRDKKTPYLVNTVQPIASVSKTLLGLSLMKAQELNVLDLDDDINKYLPFRIINPYFPDEIITIRHLANHTSGIKDTRHYERSYIYNGEVPKFQKQIPFGLTRFSIGKMVRRYNRNTEIPQKEYLKRIYSTDGKWYRKRNFIKDRPGKVYEYSNNGAALASVIIEIASGISYIEFTQKYIINPLNMTNSGWDLNNYPEQDKSKLYPLGVEMPEFKLITLADGGFITTVEDFSKYLTEVIKGYNKEGTVLTSDSYAKMLKENITNNTGVFWSTKEYGNSNYTGHSGFDPGVQTLMFFDVTTNIGFIFFTTTNTFNNEQGKAMDAMLKFSSRMNSATRWPSPDNSSRLLPLHNAFVCLRSYEIP